MTTEEITIEEVKLLLSVPVNGKLIEFVLGDETPLYKAAPRIAALAIRQAEEIELLNKIINTIKTTARITKSTRILNVLADYDCSGLHEIFAQGKTMTRQENELKPQCATCGTPHGHYKIYLNLLKNRRKLEIYTHHLEEDVVTKFERLKLFEEEMAAQSKELEQLRQENERLREALEKISRTYSNYHRIGREPRRIAEEALAPTNNKTDGLTA